MTAATDGQFAQLQQELLDLYDVRARSRFVELAQPQMRAHVLEAGDGPPVVFLHGGDGEAVTWTPLLAQLQDDLHLYGPDRPGFGLSDRFDYGTVDLRRHAGDFTVSLLDALELESAVLMGGSMGGFFALATALDHPERVTGLILRLTGLRGNRPGTYLGAELSHITQPTLVIYGEHDWTPDEISAAAERMPNVAVLRLAGVGHFPFLQATEQTARAVREFVTANTLANARATTPV
jgi:pimeloyl-ACP methyl ester carboxylesterase